MSKLVFKPNEIIDTFSIKQIELPEKYQKNVMTDEEFKEFEVDEDGNPIEGSVVPIGW